MRLEANAGNRFRLTTSLKPQEEWPRTTRLVNFNSRASRTRSTAQELAEFLANSGRVRSCWAQQYFRYTMGRLETVSDAPLIEALADQLRNGATLAEVFKGIAFTETFKSISKPAPTRAHRRIRHEETSITAYVFTGQLRGYASDSLSALTHNESLCAGGRRCN